MHPLLQKQSLLLLWVLSWTISELVPTGTVSGQVMRISPTGGDTSNNSDKRPWRIWSGDPCKPCSITRNGQLISLCKSPCSLIGSKSKSCTKLSSITFKCNCRENFGGAFCEIDEGRKGKLEDFSRFTDVIEVGGGFDVYFDCKDSMSGNSTAHYELAYASEAKEGFKKNKFTCPAGPAMQHKRCSDPPGAYDGNCKICGTAMARNSTLSRDRAFADETMFWNVFAEVYKNPPDCSSGIEEILKIPYADRLATGHTGCGPSAAGELTFRGGCRDDLQNCLSDKHMGYRCKTCEHSSMRGEKCQYIDECNWNGCPQAGPQKGCGEGGQCVSRPNGKFCICPKGKLDGYYKFQSSIVAENDSKCSPVGSGTEWNTNFTTLKYTKPVHYQFFTLMSPFHTYKGCQITDPCHLVECKNNGQKEIVGLFDETTESYEIGDYDKMQAVEVSDDKLKCKCNCVKGFYGDLCEFKDICSSEPNRCKNGGTCRQSGNDARCNCLPGFEGDLCTILDLCQYTKSVCESSTIVNCYPCRNSGSCTVDKNTVPYAYSCDCSKTNYSGRWCTVAKGEIKIRAVRGNANKVILGKEETYRVVMTKKGDKPRVIIQIDPNFSSVLEEHLFFLKDDIDDMGLQYEAKRKNFIHEFTHSYSNEGNFKVTATLVNGYQISAPADLRPEIISSTATLDITTHVPLGVKCFPYIRLINIQSNRTVMARYKRSEAFEVEYVLQFTNPDLCTHASTKHEWSLYKLDHNFPEPTSENDFSELLPDRTRAYIEFKRYFFPKGEYVLEMQIHVSEGGKEFRNIERGYFEIYYPSPTIVIDGGSDHSIDVTKDVILDASESTDESFPELNPHLTFLWTCLRPCGLPVLKGPVITYPGYSFLPGVLYKIHLDVSLTHNGEVRTASEEISLTGAQRL